MSNTPLIVQNDPALWRASFPIPDPHGHKYQRGSALVLGGGVLTGAARLAARAAQRMGAGLVTIAAPASVAPIYAAALESVMVLPFSSAAGYLEMLNDPRKDVLLLGPGLGVGADTRAHVLAALKTRKPCVLDADALTSFADAPTLLFEALHPACVLTPHEGEWARLFAGRLDPLADKAARAQDSARMSGAVVVLKGHETVIAAPDGSLIVNNNAPPWLATAGAGDVLAGMILGLLAQKVQIFQASSIACWLHGAAAQEFGLGFIAEDLVNILPKAIKSLFP